MSEQFQHVNSLAIGAETPPHTSGSATDRRLIVLFSVVTLLVHLLTNSRYNYFRDELYYIACSQHLAWGYVDLPSLSILFIRLSRVLLGDSLFAVRFLPAVAGALTVALTGMLARELGGRAWAVALSCTASLSALVFLGIGNFFSMNAFEPLFWMGAIYLLVRIINGGPPALWLWFGVLVGLGLENKHSMMFFATGVSAAVLLTPERHHLTQKWIWLGGLIALVLALPNCIWQIQHYWPTYQLLRNIAQSDKNVVLTPPQFIVQQILIMNPATFPLWLGGLVWLLISRDGGRYRILAIAYLITLAEFIVMHGKHYYLAPVYPMLFAAGGVAVERLARWQWLRPVLLAAMVALAALLAPTVLPILTPENLVAYMKTIHFEPPRTETSHTATLPQLFADQFGWEELTRTVAHAYAQLSDDDRSRVAIFCQNYGEAGAIEFFGPKLGLEVPRVISGHQNYFLWGPRGCTGDVLLVLDDNADDERQEFESVEDLGQIVSSPWAMPWEQRNHIYLCRNLKGSLGDLWPKVKKWF